MYNMYPYDQHNALRERGTGGLGHPDWYPTGSDDTNTEVTDMTPVRINYSDQVDRTLGYVVVKEMVND